MATDVAARGLDIPHIRNVINFDVARDIDTHTHRVGRTGRAGVKGTAYTLVTEKEKEFAGHIVRNLEAANQVNKFMEDGHIVVRRGITQPYQTISVRLVELGMCLKYLRNPFPGRPQRVDGARDAELLVQEFPLQARPGEGLPRRRRQARSGRQRRWRWLRSRGGTAVRTWGSRRKVRKSEVNQYWYPLTESPSYDDQ